MKYVFILLLCFGARAENYFPVGKAGANTTYAEQVTCEQIEGQKCYEVTDCEPDECSLKEVDDLSNPIFRKENVKVCSDEESCRAMLDGLCSDGEALINSDYTEVYCAIVSSYQKKIAIAPDQAKILAKQARETELAIKIQKGHERREAIKACARLISPTPEELADCMKKIAIDLVAEDLSVEEL